MKKTLVKRLIAIWMVMTMAFGLMACSSGKEEAGGETSETEDAGDAAELDMSAVGRFAGSTDFDPDTETDAMDGNELADMPALDSYGIDWSTAKFGIIVKTLSNESWTNIAGGVKDQLIEAGVPEKNIDLVAPDSESDAEQQQALCDALVGKGYDVIFLIQPCRKLTSMLVTSVLTPDVLQHSGFAKIGVKKKDRLQLLKVFREHMLLSTVPQDSLRYVKNMTELKLLLT